MTLSFFVSHWTIWPPPEIETEDLNEMQSKALSKIPMMLRRRLTPLARMVMTAVSQCLQDESEMMPSVFSSAHGELAKSFKMLQQINELEEISPTGFSLSVHNSIAGLFAMAYRNQNQTTVIAPSEDGMAPGFLEALGLLGEMNDSEGKVLLVYYDEPLEPFYPADNYRLSVDYPFVLAMIVSKNAPGLKLTLTKTDKSEKGVEQPVQVPVFADFLNSNQTSVEFTMKRHSWQWKKDALLD